MKLFLSLLLISTFVYSSFSQNDKLNRFTYRADSINNFNYASTNYGVFGYLAGERVGLLNWPTGTNTSYLFGSGIWIGAEKDVAFEGDTTRRKLVEVSYNPNNARSWFSPSHWGEPEGLDSSLFKIYDSRNYERSTGISRVDFISWPLWINENNEEIFESDPSKRGLDTYPNGPSFVSDVDIVTSYSDSDLYFFDGGNEARSLLGYPLKLNIYERILNWNKSKTKDFIIVQYNITNVSDIDYKNCWLGSINDIDFRSGPVTNIAIGEINTSTELTKKANLMYSYGDTTDHRKEDFAYAGIALIETPNSNGSIEANINDQLGLVNANSNSIQNDFIEDEERYNFLSTQVNNKNIGDNRTLLSCGPFTFNSKQNLRFAVAYIFSNPILDPYPQNDPQDIFGNYDEDDFDQLPYEVNGNSMFSKLALAYNMYYGYLASSIENENNSFTLYPNPTSSELRIKNGGLRMGSRFEIFDLMGNKVLEGDLGPRTSDPGLSINVSNLNPGTYIIKINDHSEKFIKL